MEKCIVRIAFWFTTPKKFDPANLDNETFGGAEISAICLSRELSKLYEHQGLIDIFANVEYSKEFGEKMPYNVNGVMFKKYSLINEQNIDVLIVVRPSNILHPSNLPKRPKVVILWTGDESSQPTNQVLWEDEVIDNIDLIVTKSEWQKRDLLDKLLLLDSGKMEVMYNGFDDSFFEKFKLVNKPSFICASTIYRGVYNFVNIWPKIKERIPEATLDIFASTKLYNANSKNDKKHEASFEALSLLDGVKLKDPIPHNEFLKRLQNYYAMLYPNLGFNESSCGVALEAFGYGIQVVTSCKAGLKETLSMAPACSSGINPHLFYGEYCNSFINRVEGIWKGRKQKYWKSELKKDQERVMANHSWRVVAKKWFQLLETLLTKSKGSRKSSLVSLVDIPRTQELQSTTIMD